MSAASNYLELKLLDHALGTAEFTAPEGVYLALFTSDPTDAGTGDEVSALGTAYASKVITFDAAASGSAASAATVTFDAATGDWGTITHIGIYDAATSGNLLFHGAVTTSKTIESGDTFQVSAGNLTISLD